METRELTRAGRDTKRTIVRMIATDPHLVSRHTKRGYLADLYRFEDWRAGRVLGKLLAEEYAAHLQSEGKAPGTVNRALAALRWWARKVGDLAIEDGTMDEAMRREIALRSERVAKVQGVTNPRNKTGREIKSRELRALLLACELDASPAGLRDAALFGLGWATGARRAEIAHLTVADCESIEASEWAITYTKAKGGKTRQVWIFDGAGAALGDWLALRGSAPGPVFCPVNKAGVLDVGKGLTGEAMRAILCKRIAQARIPAATWHDFRRSFAGQMIAASDLSTASKLMGHESTDTTARYDRRDSQAMYKALQSLHVPYSGRR